MLFVYLRNSIRFAHSAEVNKCWKSNHCTVFCCFLSLLTKVYWHVANFELCIFFSSQLLFVFSVDVLISEWMSMSSYAYLMQKLHIHDAKYEDKFVENKIPEFIFQMLLFRYSQFAKYQFLNWFAQQNETTVCHIDNCLQRKRNK